MKKLLTLWLFSLACVLAVAFGLAALWTAYVCRFLYDLAEGFAAYADDRQKVVKFIWEND